MQIPILNNYNTSANIEKAKIMREKCGTQPGNHQTKPEDHFQQATPTQRQPK